MYPLAHRLIFSSSTTFKIATFSDVHGLFTYYCVYYLQLEVRFGHFVQWGTSVWVISAYEHFTFLWTYREFDHRLLFPVPVVCSKDLYESRLSDISKKLTFLEDIFVGALRALFKVLEGAGLSTSCHLQLSLPSNRVLHLSNGWIFEAFLGLILLVGREKVVEALDQTLPQIYFILLQGFF